MSECYLCLNQIGHPAQGERFCANCRDTYLHRICPEQRTELAVRIAELENRRKQTALLEQFAKFLEAAADEANRDSGNWFRRN